MRKHYTILRICLVAGALSSGRQWVMGEDFDESRMRAGRAAYQDRNYLEAIDQFRMAVFGSIDKPVPLCEGLVRLFLAQEAAGKKTDADQTLERFLQVEGRFGVLAKADLEPEIRADFRTRLTHRVPEATLLAMPTLAGLVETEEQKISKLPADQRRKTLEAAAKREPTAARWPIGLARDAMERGETKDAARWASKALTLEAANPEALALHARARLAQGGCTDVLKDLAAMSPPELDKRPDLYAGKFVCLVDGNDWAAAEQVAALVPSDLARRSDVAKAQQKLSAEQARRGAATAAKSVAAAKAAPPPAPAASKHQPAPKSVPIPAATQTSATQPAASQKKTEDAPAAATAAAATASRSREALSGSRRLVSDGKSADAERLLTEALKSDPGNRELRLALLEAACLSRSYQKGAAQIPLVLPFTDAEAAPMFYAAVILYETGRGAEARPYFERALPRVSGPLVDEYSQKILERR